MTMYDAPAATALAGAKSGNRFHCSGDGIRDVVEFEIEKHLCPALPNLPHDIRTRRSEQLVADFIKTAPLAQTIDHGQRGRGRREVERHDCRRFHVGHWRVPRNSMMSRTSCARHQASSSATIRSGVRGSRSAAVPIPTSVAPAMMY